MSVKEYINILEEQIKRQQETIDRLLSKIETHTDEKEVVNNVSNNYCECECECRQENDEIRNAIYDTRQLQINMDEKQSKLIKYVANCCNVRPEEVIK